MMSAAWLTQPVAFTGDRSFACEEMTQEQCDYYRQHWHFWYIADLAFALPTIAFFMSTIGVFILGHILSSYVLGYRRFRGPPIWQKLVAAIRFLSYRGYHVKALRWNSAPLGVLLLGLVGVIFFFCMALIPQPYYWADELFGHSPPLATRSGWLSLACMPFVFATATKTNWITALTGVSHERLQVFHRWIAYAFFVLALLHAFPFIVYHVHWHDLEMHVAESLLYYWAGSVALGFQAWLTFASHSSIRGLNYEFFKFMHFSAVVVFVITLLWHCDATLTSWHYFLATAAVYVPCYVYSWLRTLFEYGRHQKAQISVQDNGFTRISIPATFNWTPGQHCFLRFTSFGILHAMSSHPFTICSVPSRSKGESSELVFYLRHQKGFTATLYQYALDNSNASIPVLVDGPYGGINSKNFSDSDHLLVIAGGSGAGWCLPFIERFLQRSTFPATHDVEKSDPTVSETEIGSSKTTKPFRGPQHLRVILATRDISSRTWFIRTVDALLSKHASSTLTSQVRIEVHVTGDAAEKLNLTSHKESKVRTSSSESASSSDINTQRHHHSVTEKKEDNEDTIIVPTGSHDTAIIPGEEREGRPRLPQIIRDETARLAHAGLGESLGVYVCGPTTMLNDVRNAVARENLSLLGSSTGAGPVYLHSEHFSWA